MPQSVLKTITAARQLTLAQQLSQLDLAAISAKLQPSRRSLAQALAEPRTSFILECKQASPSHGRLRQHWNVNQLANIYHRYAAAISVLTEPEYFQGDFRDLSIVANSVTLPVLCKDFIQQPEHILLARYFGADAILLMMAVLSDEQYLTLAKLAQRYNLDILTEVATETELERAIRLGANIIGINNRDLHDLSIDQQRAIELAQRIPPDVLVIAASGYHTHLQIRAAAPYVDGFLIGSSLTSATNVDQACRELIYGHHKVCGLTSAADAQMVHAAGAAYGGLIFVPHSPRRITYEQAQTIINTTPELTYVGVFANQPLPHVIATATLLSLTVVQLHGDEDDDYYRDLAAALPHLAIWRAHAVNGPIQLPNPMPDRVVLDSPGGGSGKPFAWSYLAQLPATQRQHIMLAGGIGPHNLESAQATQMQCFDFNSALEWAPGRKDAGKVMQVFQQLRNYGRSAMPPMRESNL